MKYLTFILIAIFIGSTLCVPPTEMNDSFTTVMDVGSRYTYFGENTILTVDDAYDQYGFRLNEGDNKNAYITTRHGEIITKVELTRGSGGANFFRNPMSVLTTKKGRIVLGIAEFYENFATIVDVNSDELQFSAKDSWEYYELQINQVKVTYLKCEIGYILNSVNLECEKSIVNGVKPTELSESIVTNIKKKGGYEYNYDNYIKIRVDDAYDSDGFYLNKEKRARITSLHDDTIITKMELTRGYGLLKELKTDKGSIYASKDVAIISSIDANSVVIWGERYDLFSFKKLQIKKVKAYLKKCESGYSLSHDNSMCIPIIENCYSYQNTGECKLCYDGFTFGFDKLHCVRIIENCKSYDNRGACEICDDGFSISIDRSFCAKTKEHCLSYDNKGKCKECDDDSLLSSDGSVCFFIEHCNTYNKEGKCESCTSNFSLSSDKSVCVPSKEHCLSYDNKGKCKECDDYSLLSSDGSVCLFIENCNTYKEGKCESCAKGYLPRSEGSLCVSERCITFDDDGKCKRCEDGYKRSSDRSICVPVKEHCLFYDNEGKCEFCAKGYLLSDDASVCVPEHCISYDNEGKCEVCTDYFSPSTDGSVCIPFEEHCKEFNEEGQCEECDDGYLEFNNGSVCLPSIENCISYDDEGKCERCNDDYSPSFDGSACIYIENCSSYNEGKCESCTEKFTPSTDGFACVLVSVKHCINYDNKGKCESCTDGYSASIYGTLCKPEQCVNHDNEGRCECPEGYLLNSDGSVCVGIPIENSVLVGLQDIHYGQYYQDNENINIVVNLDGNELNEDFFTETNKAFFNSKNGEIISEVKLKVNFEYSDGITHVEKDLLEVNNGTISIEDDDHAIISNINSNKIDITTKRINIENAQVLYKKCEDGYSFSSDQSVCVPTIEKCITYDNEGKCEICSDDATLSSDGTLCIFIEHCSIYDNEGKCESCVDGFSPNSDGSVCEQHCISYDSVGKCERCDDGYSLSSDGFICVQNCVSRDNEGKCESCIDNYSLNSDGSDCVPTLKNCISYDNEGKCESCNDDSSFDGSVCVPEHCIEYDNEGKCESCTEGYILNNDGTFCFHSIENCTGYDIEGKCENCNNDLTPSSDGATCVPIEDNCYSYDNKGKCKKCNDGFVVNSDGSLCLINIAEISDNFKIPSTKEIENDEFNSENIKIRVYSEENYSFFFTKRTLKTVHIENLNSIITRVRVKTIDGIKNLDLDKGIIVEDGNSSEYEYATITDINSTNVKLYSKNNEVEIVEVTVYYKGCINESVLSPDKSVCLPIKEHCTKYDNDGNCKSCTEGYVSDGFVCVHENCVSYNKSGKCIECTDNYLQSSDGTTCIPENCKTFNINGKCESCNDGFSLNSDKFVCEPEIIKYNELIKTYAKTGKNVKYDKSQNINIEVDLAAEYGFALNKDKSAYITTKNGELITSVTIKKGGKIGKGNINDLVTTEGIIKIEDDLVATITDINSFGLNLSGVGKDNSLQINEVIVYYKKCAEGYLPSLDGSVCERDYCQKHYISYNYRKDKFVYEYLCSDDSCNSFFELQNQEYCIPKIKNCDKFDSEGKCVSCIPGFARSYDGSVCIPASVKHCLTYDNKGQCERCNLGYSLRSRGSICIPERCTEYDSKNRCKSCVEGYTLSLDRSFCEKEPLEEEKIFSNFGEGKKTAINSESIKLSIDYSDRYGIILDHDHRAYNSSNDRAFIETLNGEIITEMNFEGDEYSLYIVTTDKGKIEKIDTSEGKDHVYVSNINSNKIGLSTNKETVRDASVRIQNIGIKYRKCEDGYAITSDLSVCVPASIENCVTYNRDGKCESCVDYFYPSSDATECVQEHCIEYGTDGICKKELKYCSSYDNEGRCESCKYCDKYDENGKCINENDDLIVSPDGSFCIPRIENCESYNKQGKCISCSNGLTPSADGNYCSECGPGIGSCPSGKCCSMEGRCTYGSKYCSISELCQPQFGVCIYDDVVKCGGDSKKYCPGNKCCSKDGVCGTTEKHCGFGCQSEFGKCNIRRTKKFETEEEEEEGIDWDKVGKIALEVGKIAAKAGLKLIPGCGEFLSDVLDGIFELIDDEPSQEDLVEQISKDIINHTNEVEDEIKREENRILSSIERVSDIENFYDKFQFLNNTVDELAKQISQIGSNYINGTYSENRRYYQIGILIGNEDDWNNEGYLIGNLDLIYTFSIRPGFVSNMNIFESIYDFYLTDSMFTGEAKSKARESVEFIYTRIQYLTTLIMQCMSAQLHIAQLEDKSEFTSEELERISTNENRIIKRMIKIMDMVYGIDRDGQNRNEEEKKICLTEMLDNFNYIDDTIFVDRKSEKDVYYIELKKDFATAEVKSWVNSGKLDEFIKTQPITKDQLESISKHAKKSGMTIKELLTRSGFNTNCMTYGTYIPAGTVRIDELDIFFVPYNANDYYINVIDPNEIDPEFKEKKYLNILEYKGGFSIYGYNVGFTEDMIDKIFVIFQ